MRLVNATWEEKNTGMRTCEIVFNPEDTIKDYLAARVEDQFNYFVVKIPNGNLKLIHDLEDIGFRYMEMQFCISVDSGEIDKIDKRWERIIKETSCKRLYSNEDLEILLNQISSGMFTNDRISLDEKLGEKISSLRYSNWIKDLFYKNNCEIYFLIKNKSRTGFFVVRKESESIMNSVIAGIFNEFKGHGLSVALIYHYLKLAIIRDAKLVTTSFSSNNLQMLNTFTRTVAFRTTNVYYVLRKIIC